MKEVTASGQLVEEAVQSALEQLNTTRDQVEVSIIDEGRKGIFGLGSKPAIVRAIIVRNEIEETEEFIEEVCRKMNVNAQVTTTVKGSHITFELHGGNIALLIGKRGKTLNALQYLIQLVLNKDGKQYYTVVLDAEGYRGRRRETLEALGLKMADKANRINQKVILDPMPSFERKIIHNILQTKEHVSTYSDGAEPHRHIVIEPN